MIQLQLPGIEQTITTYHDFQQQLQYANVNTSPDQLQIFYASFFPWLKSVEKVHDRILQRQGIDTIVTFENGKRVYFDEKVRKKDWGDILLEEFSVWRNYPFLNGVEIGKFDEAIGWHDAGLKPGWLNGNKTTDYIAYIVKPSRKVYFLPFLLLQSAWRRFYLQWLADYGRRPAKNKRYTTTNVPVEIDILYQALYEARNTNNLTPPAKPASSMVK